MFLLMINILQKLPKHFVFNHSETWWCQLCNGDTLIILKIQNCDRLDKRPKKETRQQLCRKTWRLTTISKFVIKF